MNTGIQSLCGDIVVCLVQLTEESTVAKFGVSFNGKTQGFDPCYVSSILAAPASLRYNKDTRSSITCHQQVATEDIFIGDVSLIGKALDCDSSGYRFESYTSPQINRAIIRFLCVIADQIIALFTVLGFYRIKKKPSLECTRMFNPYIILNTQ